MKGFFVFEFAPPVQWKPSKETYRSTELNMTRIIWLWFSVTLVTGMKWTDLLELAAGDVENTTGHDEHQDNLGIG